MCVCVCAHVHMSIYVGYRRNRERETMCLKNIFVLRLFSQSSVVHNPAGKEREESIPSSLVKETYSREYLMLRYGDKGEVHWYCSLWGHLGGNFCVIGCIFSQSRCGDMCQHYDGCVSSGTSCL